MSTEIVFYVYSQPDETNFMVFTVFKLIVLLLFLEGVCSVVWEFQRLGESCNVTRLSESRNQKCSKTLMPNANFVKGELPASTLPFNDYLHRMILVNGVENSHTTPSFPIPFDEGKMLRMILIDVVCFAIFENDHQRHIKVQIVDLPRQFPVADTDMHTDNATGTRQIGTALGDQGFAVFGRVLFEREEHTVSQLTG